MAPQFIEVRLMNHNPTSPMADRWYCVGRRLWLVWLLITPLATAPAWGDPGDDAYKFAAGLYQNSRWDLAAGKFRAFIQTHPKHPKLPLARLYLGLSLVNLEQFADARTQLRQFVTLYPKSRNLADAAYRVAECSYLLNDYRAAEGEFSQFLGLAPDHELTEWALPYLGDTLLQRKKMTLAAAAFQESLKKHPDGRMADDARFGLARCYETLNRSRDALAIYRMLAGNPKARHADRAQLKIAANHFSAGDFNDAAVAYDAVKVRFPNSKLIPLAAINAGYSYYQLRAFPQAIERFTQAEQDQKQAATAGYWKALSHKSLGDYSLATRILSETSKKYPKSELADRIVYQLANSQLLDGRYADAKQSYLQIADRWPQSGLADDSLHFAAESAVYAGQLDQAEQILKKIETDYPRSPLTKRNAILKGRVWQARGGPDNIQRASQIFSQVVQTSQVAQTRSLARLYLAQSLQTLQKHQETVRAIQPLVDAIEKTGSKDHTEAFVLAAISHLALADYPSANAASTSYLNRAPTGSKRARALATRAVAQANLQHRPQATADLKTLQTEFSDTEILLPTILKMSEATYAGRDWEWSKSLFVQLSDQSNPVDFRARGLSGWGWCQFQLTDYAQAAATFQRLIQQHPQHELTAEASYMRGQALQHAQQNAAATAAFLQTFERYAPPTAAAAGTESTGTLRRAFEAGLAAAQLLEADGKIDEADATYSRLAKVFPRAKGMDEILEHWAFLNLDAKKNRSIRRTLQTALYRTPQQ
jgi:TolA-binding protein